MFNISSFLNKFSRDLSNLESQKNEIARIIKEVTHIDVSIEDIEIKGDIIYLTNASPAVKNKIFIDKEKLLQNIRSLNLVIKDIR